MLKKLFTHEWKSCWRLMAAVNGVVLALTLIGLLVFRNDFWYKLESSDLSATVAGVVFFLYFMLYVISIGALSFVVSLYFYVRFFSNLYTDQGYLMHTLPVTPAQLIWSKAFVGIIWQFISGLVIILSISLMMFNIVHGVDYDGTIVTEFKEIIREAGSDWQFWVTILLTLLLAVAAAFMQIFLGYTAVSIGQLCKKQKILGAIGAYIGIYLVMQFAGSIATVPLARFFERVSDSESAVSVFGPMGIMLVVCCLVTTGLYYVNQYIMKYRLNLE